MKSQRVVAVLFVLTIALAAVVYISLERQPVDTLYVNGTIYTMDDRNTVASAFAVRGDRIVAVGPEDDVRGRVEAMEIVDLGGKTVLPGFIDAHAHLMSLGLARITVDLTGTRSENAAAQRVAARVLRVTRGEWVRGRGWDQNDWPQTVFPNRRTLDGTAPENPVYLVRVDGHAAWVNSRALQLAGITRTTADPPGGRIVRDTRGEPTGVLVDEAMTLVSAKLPPLSDREAAEALNLAVRECLSYGLTTVHDMGITDWDLGLYKRAIDEGNFPLRVYAAIDGTSPLWDSFRANGRIIGYGSNHLTVRALKLYMDGALGSRGAALTEPYSDDPGNRGLTMMSEHSLIGIAREAVQAGFQVCVHAIGDRANKLVLDAYQEVLSSGRFSDARLRVEHAQVLDPEDIPRFHELGVVPSMQPTHCTSDMYWAEARLGPQRILGAYAWRSLRETGALIPGGSDFPVESPNPLFGIYAAVTRRDQAGMPRSASDVREHFQLSREGVVDARQFDDGWYASQKLSRIEAVRMFTNWGAWAGFEEHLKGSLAAGKLADFVVLSDDIFRVPEDSLFRITVERTVVGGKEAYSLKP